MGSLQVNPEQLHLSADEVDRLLTAHKDAHTKAHGVISAAASGWVGAAAAALGAESTEWQGRSRYIETEGEHFRDTLDQIGYSMANMDEQNAVNLIQSRTTQTGA